MVIVSVSYGVVKRVPLGVISGVNSARIVDSNKLRKKMTTMTIDTADFKRHDGDCGSPEVQIASLTSRVMELNEHLKDHKHDRHSRRGLIMMVGKRNRLLKYLSRTNREAYLATIKKLGLRK
jgi:small subunit ribosomal protein S15